MKLTDDITASVRVLVSGYISQDIRFQLLSRKNGMEALSIPMGRPDSICSLSCIIISVKCDVIKEDETLNQGRDYEFGIHINDVEFLD